jgi:hypothetical protein
MSQACEWVYEVWLKLPFGFAIIRLKDKFERLGQYHKYGIWRKTEGPIGTFRERLYWPRSYIK